MFIINRSIYLSAQKIAVQCGRVINIVGSRDLPQPSLGVLLDRFRASKLRPNYT